jgi:hypothetical protein
MPAPDNPPAEARFSVASAAAWPMAVALLVRVAVWLMQPGARFASDEASYFQAGTALRINGVQDLFWPPLTGWLVALSQRMLGTASPPAIRLVWIALDLVCVVLVAILAKRVAPLVAGAAAAKARRFVGIATLAYALYLPAISHAQFTTSETPALLLTLATLAIITTPGAGPIAFGLAGLTSGLLILTRLSLAPLLALLPAAATMKVSRSTVLRATVFVATGTMVLAAWAYRNRVIAGDTTLARNSAYNLYIGNRDFYAEDLDLFSPMATSEQVAFRREFFFGAGPVYPTLSTSELQREAFLWIATHPVTFAKRTLGRLARVFVPKTDVLELAGGEAAAGIFSPISLFLLGVANVQWAVALFGGIAGLFWLWRERPNVGRPFVATIAGTVLLCLMAISKPRYSFVFDPLLLLGATIFVTAPRRTIEELDRADTRAVSMIYVFLMWGWVAWLIFAVSSRLRM